MENKTMKLYNGKVFGVEVSKYGIEHGRLDFAALSKIVGHHIFNGMIRNEDEYEWELVAGTIDEDTYIASDYIIYGSGYEFLKEYTDEIVFYNESYHMYIWGVTHYGTAWDHVLTDIVLVTDGGEI